MPPIAKLPDERVRGAKEFGGRDDAATKGYRNERTKMDNKSESRDRRVAHRAVHALVAGRGAERGPSLSLDRLNGFCHT